MVLRRVLEDPDALGSVLPAEQVCGHGPITLETRSGVDHVLRNIGASVIFVIYPSSVAHLPFLNRHGTLLISPLPLSALEAGAPSFLESVSLAGWPDIRKAETRFDVRDKVARPRFRWITRGDREPRAASSITRIHVSANVGQTHGVGIPTRIHYTATLLLHPFIVPHPHASRERKVPHEDGHNAADNIIGELAADVGGNASAPSDGWVPWNVLTVIVTPRDDVHRGGHTQQGPSKVE